MPPSIAVFGAGAVGCYFGGMLARAGVPVTLIGRAQHVDAIAREGIFFDSIHFQESVRISASTDPAAVRGAEVVFFCVKTVHNEEAARAIAPHLSPGAIVVSLQNGVDNVERIRAASGIEALPSVVYVAASMPAPGRVKHVGRGDLIFGHPKRAADVARVAALFERAGVPCKISNDIERDLWTKLIYNCAANAVSVIAQATYGQAARHEPTRQVLRATIEECVAVAHAAGVRLPLSDIVASGFQLVEQMSAAMSSTAQDLVRRKPTEIDSLNGYIVRRGVQLGVPTPVNQTLFALVKLIEEK